MSHPISFASPLLAGESALFGKVPARADFVRCGAFGSHGRALDAWLVRSVERVHARRVALPEVTARFLFFMDTSVALLGVLGLSCDKVGRRYPTAIFRALRGPDLLGCYASVPETYDAWLSEAEVMLGALPELSLADIEARLGTLDATPAKGLDAVARPLAARMGLGEAGAFLDRVFGAQAIGAQCHGLWTLQRAAGSAGVTGAANPCLELPVPEGVPVALWLALANGLVPAVGASVLWREAEPRRLLLRWGMPSDAMYCALADAGAVSSAVWPLVAGEGAWLQAEAALGSRLRELIARGAGLDEVAAWLAGRLSGAGIA